MNAFDKIIGYESIQQELLQICDMYQRREDYETLGAKLPKGVVLYGRPGLGTTLLAGAFIKESGRWAYTLRRTNGGDFAKEITETFELAKENAPCIVLLDDMDKFANSDASHPDAKEYVAVQAGIDSVREDDVFVIATVNRMMKLPGSLLRPGRFDRKIEVLPPSHQDAKKIIEHYLSTKKVSSRINMDDLAKMMSYSSCAELESILNEAAINAAYAHKDRIDMKDLVKAVLRTQYNAPDDFSKKSESDVGLTALHEAGHLVVSEVISPGSVGLASVKKSGRNRVGGFIHRWMPPSDIEEAVMVGLGGKAAVEMLCPGEIAGGCEEDLFRVIDMMRDSMAKSATSGTSMLDVTNETFPNSSPAFLAANEAVVKSEIDRLFRQTKSLLASHGPFLDAVREALAQKETLLASDIRKIRKQAENIEIVAKCA